MTQHLHNEFVEGCFRCDLSRGEMVSEEVHEVVAEQARRLAEESPSTIYMYVGHGYALVKE